MSFVLKIIDRLVKERKLMRQPLFSLIGIVHFFYGWEYG